MEQNKLISYDLGTGGIKASLFTLDGISLAEIFTQYDTFFPADKWIEQRPMDWWKCVCDATKSLLSNMENGCLIYLSLVTRWTFFSSPGKPASKLQRRRLHPPAARQT